MAPTGLLTNFCYQLYAYREYLVQSVVRDLQKKYKRSTLGYLWTMLHPLGMMGVLAIVFANIMGVSTSDYAIFLFSGILVWNFFSSTVMMSLGSIRSNARLFSQIPIPKFLFILSLAVSNLFNFIVSLIPLAILSLIVGRDIPITWLAFPITILPLFCVTVGISLILATSNVFFEDTLHISEVALQALYFLSPVLYGREHLPPWLAEILVEANPLFRQIEFIRGVLFAGVLPSPIDYSTNLLLSVIVLLAGLWIFRRAEDKFLYFV
jgi:ABC-2 type transport system permease protein